MTNRRIVQILAATMAISLLSACKQGDVPNNNVEDTAAVSNGSGSGSGSGSSTFEPIQINTAPTNQFAYPGQTARFQVAATSKAALKYRWLHDGNLINGATGKALTVAVDGDDDAGTYTVEVSNSSTMESVAARLSVGKLPAIIAQSSSVSVYPGDTAVLSVTATGSELEYTWQKLASGKWQTLSTARGTLVFSNASVADAGQYRAIISNGGGTITSNEIALTLKEPVVITLNPAPVQAAEGQTVTFTGAATGYGTLRYRWYKENYALYDSGKYAGTTTTTLTINSVTSADASLYKLKAFNADKKYAFSNPAQLSVAGPAHITSAPSDLTLYMGGSGNLIVGASGDQPLAYQWQKLTSGSWQNIGGATAAALSLNSATSSMAGSYRCVVSNASGQDASAAATVTVLQAVAITASPTSLIVDSGDKALFTVTATGDNLQYEWTKNGSVISNSGKSLTFAAAKEIDEATYGCRVYNAGSSANCTAFTLTVNSPLAIVSQPTSQNTYEGGSASFSVEASGDPTPTVQWYFGGAVVGTGATLSLSNVAISQAGEYTCVVSNSTGSVNCDPVTLTVSQAVKILQQPKATTASEGAAITLSMTAEGENLSYDWSKNGTSLGVNSPTLTFASLSTTDAGTYSCRIWNSNSSANCNSFKLTVNQGVAITTQPTAINAFEDTAASLKVVATGTPTPTVTWYRDGTLVSSNSSLSFAKLQMSDAGTYKCVVTNSVNSKDCASVTVTVREKVRITKQLANQTLNEGDTIALDIAATGEAPLNYQCYHNGSAVVAGTDPSSLIIPNAATTDAGSYYCVVSNAGSSATSTAVTVSVLSNTVTHSAALSWNAPTSRVDGSTLSKSDIAGYEIYMATSASGPFDSVLFSSGTDTQAVITGLSAGTYYFAVTTLDTNGLESEMSKISTLVIK